MMIERNSWPGKRKRPFAAVLLILLLAMAVTLMALRGTSTRGGAESAVRIAIPEPPETVVPVAPEPPEEEAPTEEILAGTVQRGESVSALLGDYLSPGEIHDLAGRSREVFPLRKVRAGQPYRIRLLDGRFQGFEYEIDSEEKLLFRRDGTGELEVLREPIRYQVRTERVAGTIESSLFMALEEAGEHAELALRLAEIFAWDVDFMLDIRSGDSFQAIVEKRRRNGAFSGYGRILAAEFINQGNVSRAFLFEDDAGRPEYYDAGGKNLRKAFLKTPLRFTRISSGFSHSRLHPIKKVRLPHPGVDYAAPTGTPVKAIGDGVVLARAYDGASGNYVKIRHSSVYETAYLHLSRFGRGIRKGVRVKQGQVIGYVGSTGLATGPHLDFRVKKHGRYINPRTLKAPPAASLTAEKQDAFRQIMGPLAARLDGVRSVAEAEQTGGASPAGTADVQEFRVP